MIGEAEAMAAQEEPWDLVVGRVAAPFGVRGAVRVRAETDSPERAERLLAIGRKIAGV